MSSYDYPPELYAADLYVDEFYDGIDAFIAQEALDEQEPQQVVALYDEIDLARDVPLEQDIPARQDTVQKPVGYSPYGLVGKLGDYRRFQLGVGDVQTQYLVDARIAQPDMPLGIQITVFPDGNDLAQLPNLGVALILIEFGGGGSEGGGGVHGLSAVAAIGTGVTIPVPGMYARARVTVSATAAANIGFGAFASLVEKPKNGRAIAVSRFGGLAALANHDQNVLPFCREVLVRSSDNTADNLFLSFISGAATHVGIGIPPGTLLNWEQIPPTVDLIRVTNLGPGVVAQSQIMQSIIL